MLLGTTRGGKPVSARDYGFKWIDLIGTVLLPLGLVFVGVHAIVRKVRKP
jgi:hypothetical protein